MITVRGHLSVTYCYGGSSVEAISALRHFQSKVIIEWASCEHDQVHDIELNDLHCIAVINTIFV